MANQLILIRHGDIGDRYRGRYVGRTDAPLSAEGRRQAATLTGPVARLNGAHFLSSPLCRTRETAEIALGANGVLKNTPLWQAVQKCSDARRAKTEERGVYGNTSSDEVCSATQQMSVFQQPAKATTPSRRQSGSPPLPERGRQAHDSQTARGPRQTGAED
jgi:bisphosphoglycerate-dependent phosphoglycerate mutase